MIKDCFQWRYAIKLVREENYLEDITSLHLLIYVFGRPYMERLEKKNIAEMIYQLELEAGREFTYASAEAMVEEWYQTA